MAGISTPISVRVPNAVAERLRDRAGHLGIPLPGLLKRIVFQYLDDSASGITFVVREDARAIEKELRGQGVQATVKGSRGRWWVERLGEAQ
mgnify:CR=1 FL=1